MDSSKCQTLTATPAEPGELPTELARTKIMQVVVYVGRRKFQESKTGEEWSSEAQRL